MAQTRIRLIFLTAAITAIITSGLWIGVGGLAYWYFVDEQPAFVVKIDSPDAAFVGEEVHLTIKVSNPTDESIELGSVDIYDSLMDGFEVLSVLPRPDSRDDSLGFTSLYYSRSLAPGALFEANLVLVAQGAGVWTGDIDCCTPLEKFVTTSHTIVVSRPSSPKEVTE